MGAETGSGMMRPEPPAARTGPGRPSERSGALEASAKPNQSHERPVVRASVSVEPWMRGPIEGVPTLLAPVLYSFQQAREDLTRFTEGLTEARLWATPHGFGSVGFHLRHIAGSTDRLMTYLEGRQLSESQLDFLKHEHDPGASREELLSAINIVFEHAEAVVRSLDVAKIEEPREIGRKKLPTTVIGLLTHIAEHTQRHVGQAISAAKLATSISL